MQSVLILGAASDMAQAIAEHFAANGYSIMLAARNSHRLVPLQTDLNIRFSTRVTLHEFDALEFGSHRGFMSSLEAVPDVTVCVFGMLGDNEKSLQDWAAASLIINTNYAAAVAVLNEVALVYKSRKGGTIVAISSVAGERGRQSNFIYGSAKAGFTAYLSGLRNYLFRYGVHVVTVQPGFVYTRMTEGLKLPAPLTAKPEEVARAVYGAVARKQNVVYVKWFWRWIMLIIRMIPEFMFKKMKL